MSKQKDYWSSLAQAAKLLGKRRASDRKREDALELLGNAFCDVELPEVPMDLSDDERRQFTRAAATELRAAFEAASKRTRTQMMGPADMARLAAATDPLWKEIAAANWHVVSEHEERRMDNATSVVMQIVNGILSRADHDVDADETIHVIRGLREQLSDETSELAQHIGGQLGAIGVGLHHLRRAAEQVLAGSSDI